MASRRAFLPVLLRTLFLLLNCLALDWVLYRHPDRLLLINLVAILLLQVILFIRYQARAQNKLDRVLASLEEHLDEKGSFDGLRHELSPEVIDRLVRLEKSFSGIRLEVEERNKFLQTLIDSLRVGIVVFDEMEEVRFVNRAALEFLETRTLNRLDHLKEKDEVFYARVHRPTGELPVLHRLHQADGIKTLSIRTVGFRASGKLLFILTMQVIQQELEEQEMESWQKLIRVLTHEIMNSSGPISSSIDTLLEILSDETGSGTKPLTSLNQEMLNDLIRGLHIIKDRTDGLSEFVRHFRSLALIPQPVKQTIELAPFLSHLLFLLQHDLEERGIRIEVQLSDPELTLQADPALLEQVFLNLMKNAVEALKGEPDPLIKIDVQKRGKGTIIIMVTDNGCGIPEELLGQVFVPFFTTRENGSGIGLSISRQIVRMHGGTITVSSVPGNRTQFRISL